MRNNYLLFLGLLISFGCNDPKNTPNGDITDPLEEEIVDENQEETMSVSTEETIIRYLALGDSYTIGESVAQELRWPVQIVNRLTSDSLFFTEDSPQIIARTGWTTDELQLAIIEANPSSDFDLVSLLIGVNNQYRGYDIEVYKKEFESLLKQSIAFAQDDASRVFVVSIPDWGAMPFATGRDRVKIAQEIDAYNAINLAISNQYDVKYFDITPTSRMAINDSELVASDGLHPSGEMYRLWAEDILPWAKETLTK